MIARHLGVYAKVIEELNAVPGVLCCYQVNIFQGLKNPESHIIKITYRCCT